MLEFAFLIYLNLVYLWSFPHRDHTYHAYIYKSFSYSTKSLIWKLFQTLQELHRLRNLQLVFFVKYV